MKVLILSRRPDLYSTRRLLEEFTAAGHSSVVSTPDAPDVLKIPADVVVPRFGTWAFEESLALLEKFERRGSLCINRTNSLRDARNKWITSLVLREEDLPTPLTTLCTKSDLPQIYPFVAKIPDLSKGEGIFLVKNAADRMALPVMPEWLSQEFIAESQGRDRRLFVCRGGLIAAMERQGPEGDFRSNLALGGQAIPYEPNTVEIDLALRALKALSLEVAGVDLLSSRRGPLINEVNGCPGLEGIEKASGINVAEAYVKIAEDLIAR